MAKLKLSHDWMAPHKVIFPDGRFITLQKEEVEVSAKDAMYIVKKHPELFAQTPKEEVPIEEEVIVEKAEEQFSE